MKKRLLFYKLGTLLMIFAMVIVFVRPTVFATPADESFDSAGVGDKGTQSYTLNGVIGLMVM